MNIKNSDSHDKQLNRHSAQFFSSHTDDAEKNSKTPTVCVDDNSSPESTDRGNFDELMTWLKDNFRQQSRYTRLVSGENQNMASSFALMVFSGPMFYRVADYFRFIPDRCPWPIFLMLAALAIPVLTFIAGKISRSAYLGTMILVIPSVMVVIYLIVAAIINNSMYGLFGGLCLGAGLTMLFAKHLIEQKKLRRYVRDPAFGLYKKLFPTKEISDLFEENPTTLDPEFYEKPNEGTDKDNDDYVKNAIKNHLIMKGRESECKVNKRFNACAWLLTVVSVFIIPSCTDMPLLKLLGLVLL